MGGGRLSLSLSLSLSVLALLVGLAGVGWWGGAAVRADGAAVSVSAVWRDYGSAAGGETVTITGTGFELLNFGTPTDFSFEGYAETYDVLNDGVYRLEVWGAAAGGGGTGYNCNFQNTGLGGYAAGSINLNASDNV
ncbi:MAG: hypothetical protein LBK50_02460, partial [Candidatus Nomurabacteria bacterium]|nr:hypothetical protein [Candidatus Nomurabacteria bacterium]